MQRRSFIRKTGMAGVLAAGAAPAIVHAQSTIRWRLASSFPKSLDTIFGAAEVFAKKVSDLTGGKFQISTHAAGELMPAFGVVDGVQNATVEMRAHGALLLLRQGPGVRARLRHPVRPQLAPDDGVDVRGQRPEADARVLRQVQHHQLPGGQHRRADGRLLPQGNQVDGRHEGPEVPHRRLRRQGDRADRRRAAEHSGRRDLPGAREGHDRRRRVGRPVRRPEARPLQGRAELRLPGLVGRRPAARPLHQHEGVGRAHAGVQGGDRGAAAVAHVDMQAKYDARNPARAEDPGRRAAPSCSASRRT